MFIFSGLGHRSPHECGCLSKLWVGLLPDPGQLLPCDDDDGDDGDESCLCVWLF